MMSVRRRQHERRKTIVFLVLATVSILPLPTLVFAWMTGKTLMDVLFR